MTDKEIWAELETIKASYTEGYIDEKKENQLTHAAYKMVCSERGHDVAHDYDAFQMVYTEMISDLEKII